MTSRRATIGVYLILNTVTGAFYVGSSAACELRMQRHFWSLRKGNHSNRELQAHWNAYGPGAMAFGMLVSCFTLAAALDYEQQMIDAHIGSDLCLNALDRACTPVSRRNRKKPEPVRTPEQIRTYKREWWRAKHGKAIAV